MNFALTKDDNKAELLSICINFMKFPLAIMVVVLHSTLIGKPIERVGIDNIDAIAPQYSSITWFFGNFIGNCAVPIFFIISGFLLFYNIEKYTAATYAYKMKKRFYSLLVPYLTWNTLYLILFYIIGQNNVVLSEVPELYGDNTSLSNFLYIAYVRPPVDGPLWFIRNLIVMDLISPILYVIIKNTKFYFPLMLLIATQVNMNSFALSFLWFSFGIACAVHKFDFFHFCRHYLCVNSLISALALILDYVCYYMIDYHVADHFYIFRIMAIIGCFYLICERFPKIMGGGEIVSNNYLCYICLSFCSTTANYCVWYNYIARHTNRISMPIRPNCCIDSSCRYNIGIRNKQELLFEKVLAGR